MHEKIVIKDYLLPYDKWMLSGYEIVVLQYWFCEEWSCGGLCFFGCITACSMLMVNEGEDKTGFLDKFRSWTSLLHLFGLLSLWNSLSQMYCLYDITLCKIGVKMWNNQSRTRAVLDQTDPDSDLLTLCKTVEKLTSVPSASVTQSLSHSAVLSGVYFLYSKTNCHPLKCLLIGFHHYTFND